MNEPPQQLSQAETNRLIRADLKACFPGTRFTVRAANGAGITQTVIGWEIGYRPSSADFDGYYSPATCLLAAGPAQADIDALAAPLQLLGMEWRGRCKGRCARTPGVHGGPASSRPSFATVPATSLHIPATRILTSNTSNSTVRGVRGT